MYFWLLETTLVAGILAAAAALLGRLRTISPTARHLLWLVVLIKLITPPVVRSPWALPAAWALGPDARPSTVSVPIVHDSTALVLARQQTIESPAVDASVPVAAAPTIAERVPPIASSLAVEFRSGRFLWRRVMARFEAGADSLRVLAPTAWGAGSLVFALLQGLRIVAFRRRLRDAVPAPNWLRDEAEKLGRLLQVRVPELLVVPGLGTPMLWCLGRPKLLVPARLLKSIKATRWQGILAHELAHLLRGDPWVGRVELAAGLFWWWSPLYWLTCRRLDAEAELACDAWVVRVLPHERLEYAEVLFHVCSEFSRVRSPSPALGVAGSGRFFERRLSMVLYERASCRVSPTVALAAGLLALLSLPSWSFATPGAPTGLRPETAPAQAVNATPGSSSQIQVIDDRDDDDDSDVDAMDDDDDDDAPKKTESHRDKAAEKDARHAEKDRSVKKDLDIDRELSGIEKEVESALGPDFEKKIEAWADKFAKEMEERFGENSDFAKKMEDLGKDLEKKFGEDSEFARRMEDFGKRMEKKLGPGSEFEAKMKATAEQMERKAEEMARKKEAAHKDKARAEASSKESKSSVDRKARTARIEKLEAQIQLLLKELKDLKQADDHEE